MARKKQVKTKTFKVFKGDIEYNIIEELEKKKINISELIRRLLVSEYIDKPEFKQAKIKRMLNQRKEKKKEIKGISEDLLKYEEELNKLGYELKGLE